MSRFLICGLIAASLLLGLASAGRAVPGDLDSSFGGDGRVTTDFTHKLDWAFAVALQADGNIVAAGQSGWGTRDARIAVARYLAS